MQPELQKIQKKYKGKNNDTAAMQKMQEETRLYIRNTAYLLQEAVYSLQSSSLF